LVRLAILKFGDEWCVQSERRRIGHFPQADSAVRLGVGLALAARNEGHEVELLVQDASGRMVDVGPNAGWSPPR